MKVQDDGSVQEPVEHGRGDGRVAEDLAPGADSAVAGQDDAGLEVALGDDLEDRGGGLGGQGEVAELVDRQERRAGVRTAWSWPSVPRSRRGGSDRPGPPRW